MAQAATHARAAAAVSLKVSIRELVRYKDKPTPNKRLLRSRLDKIVGFKADLIDKRYPYTEKSGEDLESSALIDWLTPKLDEASDLCDEVKIMIEDMESNEDAQQKLRGEAALKRGVENEIKVAQLQSKTDEKTLQDRVPLMMTVVNNDTRTSDEDANLIR